MGKRVCINGVRAEMLQHTAHHAFPSGNIASEADHKFTGPITHSVSSLIMHNELNSNTILMSFLEMSTFYGTSGENDAF
jgi:hypothetical protein